MYDAYAHPGESRQTFFARAGISSEPPFGHHCVVRLEVAGSRRLVDLTLGQVNRLVGATFPQAVAYQAGSELPLHVAWGELELRYWTAETPNDIDDRYAAPEFSVAQALLQWLRVGLELGDVRHVYDVMRAGDAAGYELARANLRSWRSGAEACSREQWASDLFVPNGSELQRRGQLSRLPDAGSTPSHQEGLPANTPASTTARGGSPRV